MHQRLVRFGHTAVGKNVGLGLSLFLTRWDRLGEQCLWGFFIYIKFGRGDHKLAFGLKMGLTFHNVGLYSDINYTLPQTNRPCI